MIGRIKELFARDEMGDSPCPPDIEEVIIPGSVRWIDAQAFTSWSMFKPFPHLHTVRYQGTLRDWCGIRKGWSSAPTARKN